MFMRASERRVRDAVFRSRARRAAIIPRRRRAERVSFARRRRRRLRLRPSSIVRNDDRDRDDDVDVDDDARVVTTTTRNIRPLVAADERAARSKTYSYSSTTIASTLDRSSLEPFYCCNLSLRFIESALLSRVREGRRRRPPSSHARSRPSSRHAHHRRRHRSLDPDGRGRVSRHAV